MIATDHQRIIELQPEQEIENPRVGGSIPPLATIPQNLIEVRDRVEIGRMQYHHRAFPKVRWQARSNRYLIGSPTWVWSGIQTHSLTMRLMRVHVTP